MRIFIFFVFILLIWNTYATTKYGLINPTGYKLPIYTESLDPSIFSNSIPDISYILPDQLNFNLICSLNDNILFELERRDNRFIQFLGFSLDLTKNITISEFNINSEDSIGLERLIHHGLLIKKSGLLTTNVIYIKSFSPVWESGFKLLVYNKLSLKMFELNNIFENKGSYITPLNVLQDDSTHIKSNLIINYPNWLETTLSNNLEYKELYSEIENWIKFNVFVGSSEVSFKSGIKKRTLKEYSNSITLKNTFKYLENEIYCKIRYINAPLLTFSNIVNFTLFKNIDFDLGYKLEKVEDIKHEINCTFSIDSKYWKLGIKYTYPVNSLDNFWLLEATIRHK